MHVVIQSELNRANLALRWNASSSGLASALPRSFEAVTL